MEYRYLYNRNANTPAFMVTVEVLYAHISSPNVYVNDKGNMLLLDIRHADEDDHMVFNGLINADTNDMPDRDFNIALYNWLITATDDDAEDTDAENENTDGPTDGAPPPPPGPPPANDGPQPPPPPPPRRTVHL